MYIIGKKTKEIPLEYMLSETATDLKLQKMVKLFLKYGFDLFKELPKSAKNEDPFASTEEIMEVFTQETSWNCFFL